jgi:hypothetical protein
LAVWAAAMLTPFQPLAAQHCTCAARFCEQKASDGRDGPPAADEVKRTKPQGRCSCCRHRERATEKPSLDIVLQAFRFSPCRCPITCECHQRHSCEIRLPTGGQRNVSPESVVADVPPAPAFCSQPSSRQTHWFDDPVIGLDASARCVSLCRLTI